MHHSCMLEMMYCMNIYTNYLVLSSPCVLTVVILVKTKYNTTVNIQGVDRTRYKSSQNAWQNERERIKGASNSPK